MSQKSNMIPVVISGGSGTRLWPVSRADFPKQFCEIFEDSLQSLTIKRLQPLGAPWVLTGEALRTLTEIQLRSLSLPGSRGLFEPMAKNTAPAMAYLLKELEWSGKLDEVIGVFPADQLIQKDQAFYQALERAVETARSGKIVTLGIRPTEPNTGYGYIQVQSSELGAASSVLKFHEKPNRVTAEKFLQEGRFFWNAGIFVFKARVLKEAFEKHQPEITRLVNELKPDRSNLKEIYARFPSISIDYAIIEKLSAQELFCVPADLGWSDVGSWDAVAELLEKDNSPQRVSVEAKNNFVFSLNKSKVYSFVGVEDVILVDTVDATLVLKKGQSQLVKQVVDQLAGQGSSLIKSHVFERRPWGKFEVLRDTNHFKSKVIEVDPGQQLSLQSHTKREEHWIIIQGSGEVVLNDKIVPVTAGSYVHIPLGAKHRMRNTGVVQLQFVEVQMGNYFGEDDIIRYQDDYKRV